MSRYVMVKTQLQDMGLLRQTVQCMGLATWEGAQARAGAGARQADLVVETPAGPVGFAQSGDEPIQMVGMEEVVRREAGDRFLRQVTQQYARRKVIADAESAGYRLVEETVESDDSIRLVVRKW